MELHIREQEKQIEVWLTRGEREAPEIKHKLEKLYRLGKEKHYLVAVFLSGQEDMCELTGALLRHNRDSLAYREIQGKRGRERGA